MTDFKDMIQTKITDLKNEIDEKESYYRPCFYCGRLTSDVLGLLPNLDVQSVTPFGGVRVCSQCNGLPLEERLDKRKRFLGSLVAIDDAEYIKEMNDIWKKRGGR